jgi:hypothetical protein
MARGDHDGPDPVLLLAIRGEIEGALRPVREDLQQITSRLAAGDTTIALLSQRFDTQEKRCQRHDALQPKTDKTTRREMNPILMAAVTAIVTTLANLTLVWWLMGVGGMAAKASP